MSYILGSMFSSQHCLFSVDNMFDIEKVKKMSECELQELLASLDSTQDLDALAFCLAEIARDGAIRDPHNND